MLYFIKYSYEQNEFKNLRFQKITKYRIENSIPRSLRGKSYGYYSCGRHSSFLNNIPLPQSKSDKIESFPKKKKYFTSLHAFFYHID